MTFVKIGNVNSKNRLFLAPMADVTDLPYRIICREAGAGMAYTEMIYLDALMHLNQKTLNLMNTSDEDSPLGIQIAGNNSYHMGKAIRTGLFDRYSLVDINCGCPSVKITGCGAGSFLLKNPEKIKNMIKALKNSGYTATAKVRLGFKSNNVLKVSKIIEKAGADAITIHARLAFQGYDVRADWNQIKKVKENIGIPVIGNGDIFTGKDAEKMLEIADGAMIARAAIGKPSVFESINQYIKTGKEKEFNFEKNFLYFKKYLNLAEKYNIADIARIKYIGTGFLRNFEGAAKLRQELMRTRNLDEINWFIKNIKAF